MNNLEFDTFLKNFAEQFEHLNPEDLHPDDKIRGLEGWSSLTYLSVITMLFDEYKVSVNDTDMKGIITIADLYEYVKGSKQ